MTNRAWTLRDVQRMLARHAPGAISIWLHPCCSYPRIQRDHADAPHLGLPIRGFEIQLLAGQWSWGKSSDVRACIDRLISALGPDWPAKQERPKETDEVTPEADPGDSTHGGDGASGECAPNDNAGGEPSANNPGECSPEKEGEDTNGQDTASAAAGGSDGEQPATTAGTPGGDRGSAGDCPSDAPQGAGSPPRTEHSEGEPQEGELTAPGVPGTGSTSAAGDTPGESSDVSRSSAEAGSSAQSADQGQGTGEETSPSDQSEEHSSGTGSSAADNAALDPVRAADQRLYEALRRESDRHENRRRMWIRRLARQVQLMRNKAGTEARVRAMMASAIWSDAIQDAAEAWEAAISEIESGPCASVTSLVNRDAFGGDFGPDLVDAAKHADARLARRIQRALRDLVEQELGPVGDPTPRIDGRRLIRELTSRSARLGRCRKSEHEPKLAVIAVDVSGSCSSYCVELATAAVSLAKRDPRVVLLAHSNGEALGWYGEAMRDLGRIPEIGTSGALWSALAERCALCVALGDHDAEREYRAFTDAGARLVWLHNYCASHGPRKPGNALQSWFADWRALPILVQGVGSGPSVVRGLRIAKEMQ